MTNDITTTTTNLLEWTLSAEPTPGLPQIHRAIHAAKIGLPPVSKDGELKLGEKKVPFTRMEDIRHALYPVLAQFGLNVYLQHEDSQETFQEASEAMMMATFYDERDAEGKSTGRKLLNERGEVRDGKIVQTRHWVTVVYTVRFTYVGDGSFIEVKVAGSAYDTNSDKATGKATTAAVKRAFTETFDIIDSKEEDPDATDPGEQNRPMTTDRREGGDRGSQARAAASTATVTGTTRRSGPPSQPVHQQPSDAAVAQADTGTGEIPEQDASPLDDAKARVRKAVSALQARDGENSWQPTDVDKLATTITGKSNRAEWINTLAHVRKLADALEMELQPIQKG